MAGPLPNFHIAPTSPPTPLNHCLLKSTFHLCYLRPGPLFPGSHMTVCFLSCSSQACSSCFPGNDDSKAFLFPEFPSPGNLKSHLCLPAQPLATSNVIYQLEPTWGRD